MKNQRRKQPARPASQSIALRIGSWQGDRMRDYPLPRGWRATVLPMADGAALDAQGLGRAFREPVGSAPIHVLAKGRASAVLIVDDLSRPTPQEAVCLAAMDELNRAGIKDGNISILAGGGCHRPLTRREIRLKVGAAIRRAGLVAAHDAHSDEVEFLGVTSLGTPILVNRIAVRAEFRMALGGVYPLEVTGFGGGAKLVLPGISHVSAIAWNHRSLKSGRRAHCPEESQRRIDIEEYAGVFGLDAVACSLVNSRRELAGLFVGDPLAAHRRAVSTARGIYATAIGDGHFDLTIANAYPMDADAHQMCKSTWPIERFGCPLVLISEFADPYFYHGLGDGPFASYRRRRPRSAPPQDPRRLQTESLFVYNPFYDRTFFPPANHWFDAYYENDWVRLTGALAKRFPRARVRVLPAAAIQYA